MPLPDIPPSEADTLMGRIAILGAGVRPRSTRIYLGDKEYFILFRSPFMEVSSPTRHIAEMNAPASGLKAFVGETVAGMVVYRTFSPSELRLE